ncbi:TPA: AlpA family phage regulatory protein [Klebsiella oxytoca]|uniref:AlpA family phage regulatory protein n=1 Tax=Klebsiella oxytoca TaxID=571 RepID=A0AAN5L797_KLEOX|nr:AlpA family phage regulatory protein [Klebsiella oxytoca]
MERSEILKMYGERERLVREAERKRMTGLSRSTVWRLEREGCFPTRKHTGKNSCGWLLSELLLWMYDRTSDKRQAGTGSVWR